MIVSLEEAKEWLAVDHSIHDFMIERVISASETYVKNATGHVFDSTNELAQQLCLVLIVDMYDKRTFAGPSEEIKHIVKSMIEQLTYCYIAAPTGLNATVVDTMLTLEWVASGEPYLLGYKVYKDSVEIAKTSTNSYKTDYITGKYQVSVYNRDNDESSLSKGVIL